MSAPSPSFLPHPLHPGRTFRSIHVFCRMQTGRKSLRLFRHIPQSVQIKIYDEKTYPIKSSPPEIKQTVNRRSGAKTKSEDDGACAAGSGDRAALIAPSFAVTPEQLAKAEKSILASRSDTCDLPFLPQPQRLSGGSDRLRARIWRLLSPIRLSAPSSVSEEVMAPLVC